ncbi:MAG: ABC transporter permease [Erysipelotrichia bacterium]|jgi:putative ABC transport system permease protein|nr:ABC transporter permease [Erysipelotrichia bacterium]
MIKEYFVLALKSVWAHKIRALLTTLGVIIGVSSVILLMSLGNSARTEAANQIRSIGSNLIFVSVFDRQGNLPNDWISLIKEQADIDAYSPLISSSATYQIEGQNIEVSISGVNEKFAYINSLDMSLGRFLNEYDVAYNTPVVVLGSKIPDLLLPNQSIIGSTIMIKGIPFEVIGVAQERGTNFSGDNDMMVYIPIDYASTMSGFSSFSRTFYIAANSEENIDFTLNRVLVYLSTVFPSDSNYRAFSQTQILGVLETILGLLTSLLAGIASISLVVGGIGIMNIMLVTVRERTKEIGIRKALGARQSQILAQFLIEAILITTLGGILGLGVSYIGTLIISWITDFNVILGFDSVILSLTFSIVIGVIFGLYPAYNASKLEPVEALRFE